MFHGNPRLRHVDPRQPSVGSSLPLRKGALFAAWDQFQDILRKGRCRQLQTSIKWLGPTPLWSIISSLCKTATKSTSTRQRLIFRKWINTWFRAHVFRYVKASLWACSLNIHCINQVHGNLKLSLFFDIRHKECVKMLCTWCQVGSLYVVQLYVSPAQFIEPEGQVCQLISIKLCLGPPVRILHGYAFMSRVISKKWSKWTSIWRQG